MPELTIAVRTDGAGAVVVLAGEVDLGNAPRLRRAIRAALASRPKALAVDMAGVTFCDSTGLSVLVGGRMEAEVRGVDYRITNPSGMVASVLRLTGLLDHLRVASENGAAPPHAHH